MRTDAWGLAILGRCAVSAGEFSFGGAAEREFWSHSFGQQHNNRAQQRPRKAAWRWWSAVARPRQNAAWAVTGGPSARKTDRANGRRGPGRELGGNGGGRVGRTWGFLKGTGGKKGRKVQGRDLGPCEEDVEVCGYILALRAVVWLICRWSGSGYASLAAPDSTSDTSQTRTRCVSRLIPQRLAACLAMRAGWG